MSTTAKTATKTGARTMTKSAFADLLSVSRSAVSVWIRRRKLTAPALRPNGMIDVDRAKRQLAETIGYGRAPSPEAAAARSKGVAENALVSRLARARADLLAVQAADRDFTKAVAAGRYVLVDDVERPFVRELQDVVSALESWVETAPDVILAVTDNGVALDRLRGSFASMWLRVRGLDDTERNGAADLAPRPPAPRPDAAPAAGHPGVDGPPAARRPRPRSRKSSGSAGCAARRPRAQPAMLSKCFINVSGTTAMPLPVTRPRHRNSATSALESNAHCRGWSPQWGAPATGVAPSLRRGNGCGRRVCYYPGMARTARVRARGRPRVSQKSAARTIPDHMILSDEETLAMLWRVVAEVFAVKKTRPAGR